MTQRPGSAMPLHERAEPAFRVIAAGMAVVFACTAAVMVSVAMDESTWATARVGSRGEGVHDAEGRTRDARRSGPPPIYPSMGGHCGNSRVSRRLAVRPRRVRRRRSTSGVVSN